jgi:hypothetical protein
MYSFEKSGYKEKVDEVNMMLNTITQQAWRF